MGGCLVRDFENFNFLRLEIPRTRENRFPVQSGVVRVTVAKAVNGTARVCVAFIANSNDITVWTAVAVTIDCQVVLFGLVTSPSSYFNLQCQCSSLSILKLAVHIRCDSDHSPSQRAEHN
jgi:hypothetical protein